LSARVALPLAILLGVLVRVPFWVEALRTPIDGDTAIVGLMAAHPGEGTTLWGQPYGSPVEAWLAAPFVAALGPTTEALRLFYFLLGLALIPIVYAIASRLDVRAALPAALLLACPPPYFLLLSVLPPPLYPAALALLGASIALTLYAGERLAVGETVSRRWLVLLGALGGLAVWTHLMSLAVLAACAVYLFARARGRRHLLAVALLAFLTASAPWWTRALYDASATRIVNVSDRRHGAVDHLRELLPRLHEPLAGVLGSHTPLVPDDPDAIVWSPRVAAGLAIFIYGACLVFAARSLRDPRVALLLAAAGLTVLAFPFPLRSGPATLRFLTPLYLPLAALVAWVATARGSVRRSYLVVLALAALHLAGASRLLSAWHMADRTEAPYLLPDLAPLRTALERNGIRRAYASYGPAYRLTYETGERIVVSQPWNERFLHHPLPYLDDVRFTVGAAWILTPHIPSDLPTPQAFEAALRAAGGTWRRTDVGDAIVYHGFAPPYSSDGVPLASAGAAGDGELGTQVEPDRTAPTVLTLSTPQRLDALTLLAGFAGPPLPRSFDVEVSADGLAFEKVAERRRRGERGDLRWVNGHPQYVLDHDLLSVPLGGRMVSAVRLTPVASGDAWALAEVLLHPSRGTTARFPWDDALDPDLTWRERRRFLVANPRRDREDWYYRRLLAERH
jgi:hypothetical protein